MSEVTRIFQAMDAGDPRAAEQLLPLVYDELRQLAAAKLAHEKPGQTLNATGLVHEAYMRLVGAHSASEGEGDSLAGAAGSPEFANRGHFFSIGENRNGCDIDRDCQVVFYTRLQLDGRAFRPIHYCLIFAILLNQYFVCVIVKKETVVITTAVMAQLDNDGWRTR